MKKLIFISGLITLFACGCNNAGKQKLENVALAKAPAPMDASVSESKSVAPQKPDATLANSQDVTRKIIKEGEISFETKNLAETRMAIYNALQKLGGYIAEENESNDSSATQKQYELNVRIPEKNFEEFLINVSSNAVKIASKNIQAKDVTAEYIDVSTRLANKKKLAERYVELLKKGNKMADLLEIEGKINDIQTEIDSTQGQLNYLLKQVDYSTLDITFYTKQIIKDNQPTFAFKLINALKGGWDMLGEVFFSCLAIWPLWIILALTYVCYRQWRKKHPHKLNVQP